MMQKPIIKTLVVGQMAANCYILADQLVGEAIIIDPGDDAEYIINTLRDLNVTPTQIIATHGHFDHILAAFELQQAYQIPFLINQKDVFLVSRMQETAQFFLKMNILDIPPKIDAYITGQEKISCGKYPLTVIETPGHTPGSICLYLENLQILFTGDTIFAEGGIGRTDFNYSSQAKLNESIERVLALPQATVLYPGHGLTATVAVEKTYHQN